MSVVAHCPAALPMLGALATGSTLTAGGLCVEVSSAGWPPGLQLAACSGSASQLFSAGSAPNSNTIRPASDIGSCFDVSYAGTGPGTAVTTYPCAGVTHENWAVDTLGRLVPLHATNMCLDTVGSKVVAGAKLAINTCSDASSQRFFAGDAAQGG
jgi:glucosylceramidase